MRAVYSLVENMFDSFTRIVIKNTNALHADKHNELRAQATIQDALVAI